MKNNLSLKHNIVLHSCAIMQRENMLMGKNSILDYWVSFTPRLKIMF